MKIKIRLQGSKEEVAAARAYLLKFHPGLILAAPREGSNPKYAHCQKWAAYGDIQFNTEKPRFKKQEIKRKRRK